jgi:hypothetical protein
MDLLQVGRLSLFTFKLSSFKQMYVGRVLPDFFNNMGESILFLLDVDLVPNSLH